MRPVKLLSIALMLTGICFLGKVTAQIKIGTNGAIIAPASLLELESNNQGLLLPRLTDTLQINALIPPDGMLVYITKNPNSGLYIRKGGAWVPVQLSSSIKAAKSIKGDGTLNVNNSGDTIILSANSNTSIWNANKLQGYPVSSNIPVTGYLLEWNGSAWIPTAPFRDLNKMTGFINSSQLAAGSVTTEKIPDGAITAAKIGTDYAKDRVLVTDVSGNAIWVDRSSFSTNTLNAGNIFIGNVNGVATSLPLTGDIGLTTAGVSSIGLSRVTTGMILDGTVGSNDLASGAVLTDKLQSKSVTLAKLADMATSSFIGRNTVGSGTPEVLSVTSTKTMLALNKSDVGLANVENTSDANKIISSATQAALNLKAPINSPTFTGTVTLPTGSIAVTQTTADNSTKLATTAYADAAVGAAVTGKQNTLTNSSGLAGALNDETGTGLAVFATSPTLVTPALGTPSALVGTNITGTATTLNIGGNAATATTATTATSATTATNLAAGLGGQIPYQSAAGTTAMLANGSAGQVLQSNGTTVAPSWVAAATGDMTLAGVQSITGAKTFGAAGNVGKLVVAGSTSGTTILNANATAGAGTVVLPTTGTLATLDGIESLTNKTLTAPALGTPVSGVMTNVTGTAASLTAGTATNLAAGLGGQLPYQSAAGTTAMLANGTAGQVLQSNGTTIAPSWVAAATGDMTLAGVQSITGAKTFGAAGNVGKLVVAGSTSGTTILNANATAGAGTVVLPTTGTLATLDGTETLTNKTLTSPTLTTPTIGVATATSVNKVAITAPATGSTLTIADGKTLTASNSLTFTGTDASTLNIGTGGTLGTNAFTNTLTGSATLDFGSVTGIGTSEDLPINVTNAALSDNVSLGIPNASIVPGGIYIAWVSSAGVVTVRVTNVVGGSINPASGLFKVLVHK